MQRWRWKRSQRVCLQTLHRLTGEGSHDEATQGTISNLLDGEVCEFHCRRDLGIWPVFEILNALLDLIWVNRLDLTIVADGITTKSRE